MEEIKIGLHNEWKIVVRDAKTLKEKRRETGHNILLDKWWDSYMSLTGNDALLSYIHFGSGTVTPVATNTKLTTPVDSKAVATSVTDISKWKSDGIISVQKSCRLQASEYVGSIISEVGFASSSTTTANLVTHSLIADQNGNALAIEKKMDEVIDIYGTVFFKIGYEFDDGRVGYSLNADSRLLTKILCAARWAAGATSDNYYSTRAYKLRGSDHFASEYMSSTIYNCSFTFDRPNKKIKFNIPDATVAAHNLAGGICSLVVQRGLQILLPCTGFTQPVITKEVLGTGDGVTQDFQTAFGFVRNNGTFQVFVNDVEVSSTADYDRGYPNSNLKDVVQYLEESESFLYGGVNKIVFDAYPYNSFGIDSIKAGYATIYTSDDGTTWEQVLQRTSALTTLTVPAAHKNKRYWKMEPYSTSFVATDFISSGFASSKNVHLDTAPAVGDTITVTYQPNVIAKDAKHTLKNQSVTFTFNEYTP